MGMSYFGALAFAEEMAHNTFNINLTELDLHGNNIITDGAVAVANVIGRSHKLRCLQLNDVKMGTLGALRLSTTLITCTNLRELHIAGNRISVKGGGAVVKALPCYQVGARPAGYLQPLR